MSSPRGSSSSHAKIVSGTSGASLKKDEKGSIKHQVAQKLHQHVILPRLDSLSETMWEQVIALGKAAEENLADTPRDYPFDLAMGGLKGREEANKIWDEDKRQAVRKSQEKAECMRYLWDELVMHPEKERLIPLLFKSKDYIDFILKQIFSNNDLIFQLRPFKYNTKILDLLLLNESSSEKLILFLAEFYNQLVIVGRERGRHAFAVLFNYLALQGKKAGEIVVNWMTEAHPSYCMYENLIYRLTVYSADLEKEGGYLRVVSLEIDPVSHNLLVKYKNGEIERLKKDTFEVLERIVPSKALSEPVSQVGASPFVPESKALRR